MKAIAAAFNVIPGVLWALLLAGALALIGVKHVQLGNARVATAQAKLDLANYKATAAESARLAARAALLELVRITNAQRKALDEADRQTLAAQADRATADAAAERVRKQLERIRTAVRRTNPDTAAASASPPAGDPIGVLADVLGRADARAGILAAYADRARIAGQACERSYDALIVDKK